MPFNKLTDAQAERFTMLAEEANEISHIVCKILRHGADSYNPWDLNKVTNIEHLNKELADLSAVLYIMACAGDFDKIEVPEQEYIETVLTQQKLKYTHHQND
jgi:hypothetical protein